MRKGLLAAALLGFLASAWSVNAAPLNIVALGASNTAGQGHRVGAEVGRAHRSTSPITGSTEEITATASAMSPPRIITGRPCRLTKLGPRMCMR